MRAFGSFVVMIKVNLGSGLRLVVREAASRAARIEQTVDRLRRRARRLVTLFEARPVARPAKHLVFLAAIWTLVGARSEENTRALTPALS